MGVKQTHNWMWCKMQMGDIEHLLQLVQTFNCSLLPTTYMPCACCGGWIRHWTSPNPSWRPTWTIVEFHGRYYYLHSICVPTFLAHIQFYVELLRLQARAMRHGGSWSMVSKNTTHPSPSHNIIYTLVWINNLGVLFLRVCVFLWVVLRIPLGCVNKHK